MMCMTWCSMEIVVVGKENTRKIISDMSQKGTGEVSDGHRNV